MHLVNLSFFYIINPLHIPVQMYQIFEEGYSINYCGRNAFHLLLKVMIKHLDIELYNYSILNSMWF